MAETYKISVIICTYNRARLLEGALKSLDYQLFNNKEYEIVVVYDGSTDDTREVVLGSELVVDVQYVPMNHAGRSAARNEGIQKSRGDYILFVDDDILAPPELVEAHYQAHRDHKHSVIRGPIINVTEYRIPEDRATTWRDYSSAFFCTCNASVSRFALVDIGGFDESFVEYGFEDNELGWRLRQRGWKSRFIMDAPVFHYKPSLKREQIQEMMVRAQELGRSAVSYYRKHPSWRVALATGLHPLLRWWNVLQSNSLLYNMCMKQWQNSSDTMGAGMRSFVERRIFVYHYLRSLQLEASQQPRRIAPTGGSSRAASSRDGGVTASSGETSVERTDGPGHIGPTIGESGRIVNKNISPNVHVQSKTPPGKGSGSAF